MGQELGDSRRMTANTYVEADAKYSAPRTRPIRFQTTALQATISETAISTMHIPTEALTSNTILKAANRLPFSSSDAQRLSVHLENARKHRVDLEIDLASSDEAVREILGEGFLVLRSSDLQTDILLVNVDAGKSFFGRQKSQVLTYTSDIYRDHYYAGPVLENLLRALVGINNLYRAAGFLKGPAI